jgi:filamentous hemagglutinin
MRIFPQRFPRKRETLLALGASAFWSGSLLAGTALPIPCAPGSCGAKGASQFVTGGAATAVATQNALTVNQTTSAAILNWSSFNIGANGSVTFKQPSSSSIALNRIFQGNPSQIFGQLNANGQVYLINLNGFLFGSTSTINVGSLLVSSLPLALTDANFTNGILSTLPGPILDATQDPLASGVGRASVLDVNGNPVHDANGNPLPVQIVVQPGAQMTAADQGRILLAGQSVTNGGTLTARDGQVVLAAGTQVFLQADSDPTVRGLIVEVDVAPGNSASNQLTAALSNQATGTVSNQATGTLSAPRGNITMVGLAVNQDGRISATTSVSANGSIRLEAADNVPSGSGAPGSGSTLTSSQGGTLIIGPQSQMEILPELSSSDTAAPGQTQYSSSITLLGQQVSLQGGSIVAPGGNLTAIAAANPATALQPSAPGSSVIVGVTNDCVANQCNAQARLNIDSGTTVDLSGSDATLPVSANLVSAQLRSTELADDPTQRNGALHGLTVYVDSRDPPPATLADVSGEIANVAQNIAQRTETGGKAIFESEGDIAFAKGASVNVSGGSTTYLGGVMQTTYLVGANGQLYPIATANPLLTYVGVLNPTFSQTYDKWGVQEVLPTPGLSTYQPGYVEGASAGSVQFAAPTLVLQGSLQGSAVNGLYQRTPSTSVSGGQLTIGLPAGLASSATTGSIDYLSPAIELTTSPTPLVVSDNASPPSPLTLQLPVSYLTSSGFTSTQIYGNYGVTLPVNTPLVLPSGSTLSIDAARIDVLSSITDPAGTLSFQNVLSIGTQVPLAARSGVFIGEGVTLDVRGQWTNDMPSAQAGALADTQTWQNGGSIDLGVSSPGALLSIADDVTLRVSGGAWLNATGTLVAGTGGTLTLNEDAIDGGFDLGNNVAIDGFGVNGATGGTFNFTAPRVEISSGNGNWASGQQVDDTLAFGDVFQLRSSLFADYGFETLNVAASGLVAPGASSTNVLSIDSGTVINATVSSLNLVPHVSMIPSSTTLDGVATVSVLAPYQRPAATVGFTALPPAGSSQTSQLGSTTVGDILVGAGASITTDAGGAIDFTGLDSIIIDGTLRAPGGTVSLHVLSPAYTLPGTSTAPYSSYEAGFLPNQRIELGSTGKIDVSGTFVSRPSSTGLDLGTVYAGGSVTLLADRGAVVTDAGSSISVAGTDAT